MTTPRPATNLDSVLDYQRALIQAIAAHTADPAIVGWTLHESHGAWSIEVYLQSESRHAGRIVGVRKSVPTPSLDLGMDMGTHLLVQASGLIECFVARNPASDPYIRYIGPYPEDEFA